MHQKNIAREELPRLVNECLARHDAVLLKILAPHIHRHDVYPSVSLDVVKTAMISGSKAAADMLKTLITGSTN